MPAQSFFYSFDLTLSDSDRGIFIEKRLRLSRSFSEPMDRIFAKVLAYCHAYESDFVFSNGQDVTEPVLLRRSLIGDYTDWLDIGCPSSKKLNKVIRSHSKPKIRLYFFRQGNQAEFAREYRGLEAEYARRVEIFEIDPIMIAGLGDEELKSFNWSVTFLDGGLYLDDGKRTHESSIRPIDAVSVLSKSLGTEGSEGAAEGGG